MYFLYNHMKCNSPNHYHQTAHGLRVRVGQLNHQGAGHPDGDENAQGHQNKAGKAQLLELPQEKLQSWRSEFEFDFFLNILQFNLLCETVT